MHNCYREFVCRFACKMCSGPTLEEAGFNGFWTHWVGVFRLPINV